MELQKLDSYMKYIQHHRREQTAAMHETLQFRIGNIRHLNVINDIICQSGFKSQ